MMGLTFYLALIFLGGSMGLPMGMPPGPEDPLMARVAPDDCAFYASWSPVAPTDPNANPTEKWLSQPMTSKALVKLRKAYRGFLIAGSKNVLPAEKLANELLVEVIGAGSVNAAAMYIDQFKVDRNAIEYRAGLIVALGDHQTSVENKFSQLFEWLNKTELDPAATGQPSMVASQVDGEKQIQLTSPINGMPIKIVLRDGYFMLGIGNDALEQLKRNSQTPAPQWLTEMKDRLKVDRISSVGFVDTKIGNALFGISGQPTGWGVSFAELFQGVEAVGWVTGLDSKGSLSRSEIRTDRNPGGILSLIDLQPIPREFLDDVPADTTLGLSTRISPQRILEIVKTTAKNAGQEEPLNEALDTFQQVTGVRLEDELLAAVGDYVNAHYTLNVDDWQAGWVLDVRIEDEMSFPGIFEQINLHLKRWIEDQEGIEFSVKKHELQDIYSITSERGWSDFSWAVVDDQWFFARRGHEIIRHLKGQPDENQYLNDESIQEIFDFSDQIQSEGPVTIAHFNLTHVFEAARPFLEMILKNHDPVHPDFDFNWNDVPPVDEWVSGVRPNYMAVYRTERGFQLFQRQTYPGSSPAVTLAASAVGVLPLQMAEIIGQDKLQRLGKAHLDFEKQHRHLCAAYSTNAQGAALLSWRVHLLPFLGYQDLYREFRLNEAWDSPHNRLLADKMPDVYRHPSMELENAHTVFLATVGKQTAFGEAVDSSAVAPLGMKIAEMQGGPEFTTAIIEVNANHSVLWTRPSDLPINLEKGVKAQVEGIRKARRFNLVLLDGSVHSVSNWMPVATLNKLFDRNQGGNVKLNRGWWLR